METLRRQGTRAMRRAAYVVGVAVAALWFCRSATAMFVGPEEQKESVPGGESEKAVVNPFEASRTTMPEAAREIFENRRTVWHDRPRNAKRFERLLAGDNPTPRPPIAQASVGEPGAAEAKGGVSVFDVALVVVVIGGLGVIGVLVLRARPRPS